MGKPGFPIPPPGGRVWAGLALAGAVSFFGALRLFGGLEEQDRAQIARLRLPLKRWWLRVL